MDVFSLNVFCTSFTVVSLQNWCDIVVFEDILLSEGLVDVSVSIVGNCVRFWLENDGCVWDNGSVSDDDCVFGNDVGGVWDGGCLGDVDCIFENDFCFCSVYMNVTACEM